MAAGHPATAEAGAEILAAGGTAADATVAAALTSCVAETVMTGLLGGGHAIYSDAADPRPRNLDCFVNVPGLGAPPRKAELHRLEVSFGAELVHYAVGPASCAVPGLPAGLHALWNAHGRLPWARLVEPALRLAQDGVEFTPAHAVCLAMLAPVMTMDAGARIYAPEGRLLEAGDRLEQPGLARALGYLAEEGAESLYRGTLARELLDLSRDRGGVLTPADLERYEPRWAKPVSSPYRRYTVATRAGLSRVVETLVRVPELRGLDPAARTVALVDALDDGAGGNGHTTNISVVDAEGSACVLTSSLGLGSGDFVPGLDLHLNSMLGEADLLHGPLVPGERMESMMAPTFVFDDGSLVLGVGSAGGTRLRTALVGVIAAILDEGVNPQQAVDRPRVHPAPEAINAEPGVDERALDLLEGRGRKVRRWPSRHHYFGGVTLVSRWGAAADPRRDGAAARPR